MPGWVTAYLTGVLTTLVIGGTVLLLARPGGDTIEVLIATPAPGTIMVAVSGEVARPGVYELPIGSRVADLLRLAGGATERADPAVPSRALLLRDEMHVHVPLAPTPVASRQSPVASDGAEEQRSGGAEEQRLGTPTPRSPIASPQSSSPAPGPQPPAPTAGAGLVNLTLAGEAELERLPGIGTALAARIVADRARNGPFRSVDDLNRVPGIGPQTVNRLRPLVTV